MEDLTEWVVRGNKIVNAVAWVEGMWKSGSGTTVIVYVSYNCQRALTLKFGP